MPLLDCTDSIGPICGRNEKEQKKTHKGQWKRKARLHTLGNKECGFSDQGEEIEERLKRGRERAKRRTQLLMIE